jgi:hypothetical protein
LVIFDGTTARLWSGEPTPDYVNRGFHLGAYKLDGSDKWAWQASPWGLWDLSLAEPEVFGDALVQGSHGRKCKGYRVQQQLIDPRTKVHHFLVSCFVVLPPISPCSSMVASYTTAPGRSIRIERH